MARGIHGTARLRSFGIVLLGGLSPCGVGCSDRGPGATFALRADFGAADAAPAEAFAEGGESPDGAPSHADGAPPCLLYSCTTPSCDDGVQNGQEEGVDCGGACAGCPGSACEGPGDCSSHLCDVERRCTAPTCTDRTKNGDETDVDCGRNCPTKCANGAACNTINDCESCNCEQGRCYPATCHDYELDGDESDMDCGGSCVPCANGRTCAANRDCATACCGAASHACQDVTDLTSPGAPPCMQ